MLLLLVLYTAIHITPVQNWIIHKVSASLSQKLHTKVSIQHIDLTLFNKMQLSGLLIEDHNDDTLLYAGDADVEITDWFFLKDKATIKYLALKDAVINMQRTDSVWNYQFLADYFASPKKDSVQKGGLELDLKTIQLQNVQFNKIDAWVGKNMRLSVKEMDVDANNIDPSKKLVDINILSLDEPSYAEFFYPGNRPYSDLPDTATVKNPADTAAGLVMNIKQLNLTNGSFSSITKGDIPDKNVFDGDYIHFFNITGGIQGLHFEKDSLAANLSLSAKERCGLEVKKIKALMKFTPDEMEFNDLDLTLNKSRLKNYYAMHFHHFSNDMANFLHNVTVKAAFQHSDVSSDDIAFFAPSLSTWKKVFNIQGEASGTIDNLVTKRTVISTGNSIVDGDIELTGLPDINNTFIDFRSNNLVTNYKDVTTIVPALKSIQQPQLNKLTDIRFKGNFTGFIKDFVAYGTIQTNLGNLTADINLKFPDRSPAVYLGKVSTTNFNLGSFVGSSDIGNISFDGTLKGQGFTANDLNTAMDGNVRQIQFDGYNYQNISLKGSFDKKLFNGNLSINDPNIKLDNLNGTIDFNNQQPEFNFDASLAQANLKALNLTQDNFKLSGHFRFNFKGSNIDNFAGTAKIYNASLLHNDVPLPFDSLSLSSQQYGNDKKLLTLHSNEVNGHINGQFKILELQDAFKMFLSHYYPAYIQQPTDSISNQDFTFDVETKDVDDYTQLIDPKLTGFSNSDVSGNLDLKNNELGIKATVPQFGYDGKVFNNIRLQSNGNLDTLTTKIIADDIQINDSLHLPSSTLAFTSHNDISDLDIETSASQTLSGASLSAQVQTLKDGVNIDFSHSSFIINDKKWDLAKDGQLTITKSQITASNIKLTQDYQQITFATQPSDSAGGINDIVVGLTKVSIGDIAPYIVKQPRLEGLLTGRAIVSNIYSKPSFAFNTTAEQFRLDGDSIGVVATTGDFSSATGLAKFHADADNKNFKFAGDGSFNLNDSSGNQLNIAFISSKFDLALLNNYLGSVFTDVKGTANTSDLKITGNTKHLLVTGTATVYNGSFRVNYTQCKYSFNNETVTFNPDEIDLGSIQLTDTLNNTATVTGKLYHNFFSNFGFNNLRFETRKLLVLNTTRKDNNVFYGKVIGSATMLLNGPVTNMLMDIDGEPSRTDSSQIYLLGDNSVENGAIDYIDFKQYGKKMTGNNNDPEASNILVNMRLTANPTCKINVILDETTGDVIQGTGNGLLNIRVGTIEPLTIRGRYDITKGNYTFNFQTFLKKPFTLNSGSIVWTGDPYQADIDIVAEYLAEKVDFSSLGNIITTGASTSTSSKSDVYIVAHLTEKLNKPKIAFAFQLPPYSELNSGSSGYFIGKRLDEFKNDENEMNKQVTSVLLLNSFIDNSQSFGSGSGVSVLSSTIGGVVSGIVSDRFNKLLEKYIKNTSFYLNSSLSSSTELEQSVAKLQAAVKSGVVVTLLNGRLVISAGVNLDYNDPYAVANTSLFVTPDFTAEWLLTKDGHVRVIGFNKTGFDVTGQQRNRSGLKLSYGKDFDLFSELFANADDNKKKKK